MAYPYPHGTPPPFHFNDTFPTSPSFSFPPVPHYQQVLPSQRVQQQQQQQQQQQNIARLSHVTAHSTQIRNGYPSTEQRAAVAILREVPVPTIFAWLEGFRSFLRGRKSSDFTQLSLQQYHAVSALSGCSNELIQEWLNALRSPPFLYASHNSHINNSFIHDGAAPDSFPQSPLSFGDLPSHVIPIDPYDQLPHNLSRDASVGIQSSPAATSKEYDGWCFLCEDNRGFTTRGGFIRHMQEHYTKYYCIPEDLVRYTQGGRTCAKCGVSDPDPKHLNTHNDSKCIGKRYTRKENLEKHLTKKHRVRHASLLAEHSGHTTLQRYFACGFCVFCCGSFNEQIHHIDAHHYKFSVQICDWDDDKVIRGLLSQPGVKEYWRYALAAHPNIQESSLTWNNPHAKELQRRLEMSQEPAVVLCHAAIHESNYGKSLQGYIDSGSVHGFTDLERHTNRSNQMFQGGNVLSPVPYMPERGSVSRTPRVTAFTLRSQQPAVDSDNFDDSDWHAIHENGPFFQGTFDMHNKTTSTVYPHTDNRAQPWSSPDSAESPIHRQYSPYMSSNTSTSGTANAFQGQVQSSPTSRPGGNSSAIPPNLAADSPPFQGLKMHNYPAQARTGVLCSTVPAQFASPPLPRISETSSGGHLTSAHTPAHHQTLNIHYSRQDTTNHIGIDMAPGTDGQQPFTPNANRSRRWGRNR